MICIVQHPWIVVDNTTDRNVKSEHKGWQECCQAALRQLGVPMHLVHSDGYSRWVEAWTNPDHNATPLVAVLNRMSKAKAAGHT